MIGQHQVISYTCRAVDYSKLTGLSVGLLSEATAKFWSDLIILLLNLAALRLFGIL